MLDALEPNAIDKQILESYDYKLVTRAEFDAATDVPDGLRERAAAYKGAFVVYDPNDDDEGFLLVGEDAAELARLTVEKIEESL